jgi:hypothetical protein
MTMYTVITKSGSRYEIDDQAHTARLLSGSTEEFVRTFAAVQWRGGQPMKITWDHDVYRLTSPVVRWFEGLSS